MAGRKTKQNPSETAADSQRIARLVPTQQRSRERFERILACAVEVMAEKGSDAFRMSDIVERTGIAFGSLYQYFPDKTAIIGTLAERYNVIGRDCVRKELSALKNIRDIHPVLCRIADSYYQFFLDVPAVRDIWQATQADRALQNIDEEDGAYLSRMLVDALQTVAPNVSERSLSDFSQMMMVLIAAAVRHAIFLPPKDGRRILVLFKRMLPKDLSALET
ncbi:TetR/AcrR family transcriptional regulator [Bradyrhizobium sp. LA6.7]|uniref:TetR/AcrR family transcriptional regulator n=1 Tax=unclassified Bradyrhizobium TaxID=2631580 RepID=UPI003393A81A